MRGCRPPPLFVSSWHKNSNSHKSLLPPGQMATLNTSQRSAAAAEVFNTPINRASTNPELHDQGHTPANITILSALFLCFTLLLCPEHSADNEQRRYHFGLRYQMIKLMLTYVSTIGPLLLDDLYR